MSGYERRKNILFDRISSLLRGFHPCLLLRLHHLQNHFFLTFNKQIVWLFCLCYPNVILMFNKNLGPFFCAWAVSHGCIQIQILFQLKFSFFKKKTQCQHNVFLDCKKKRTLTQLFLKEKTTTITAKRKCSPKQTPWKTFLSNSNETFFRKNYRQPPGEKKNRTALRDFPFQTIF